MNTEAQAVSAKNRQASAPEGDGRSTRWDLHREQRKEEILDVARRLIHARGPAVTMDEIAQASGTSKSILYRYFRDKSELQRALGLRLFNHMHRQLANPETPRPAGSPVAEPGSPLVRLEAMVFAFVSAARSSANLFEFVMQPSAHLNHFLASVRRLVRSALPDSLGATERALYAAGAVSLVQGTTERWMSAEADDPISELSAEDITALIVRWIADPPLAPAPLADAP